MREPATMTGTLDRLKQRGFTANLGVVGNAVRVLGGGKTFKTDELAILEYHRFEGTSDPDDLAIVYAIESRDGTRGALVDAFGVYADPAIGTALEDVRISGEAWGACV